MRILGWLLVTTFGVGCGSVVVDERGTGGNGGALVGSSATSNNSTSKGPVGSTAAGFGGGFTTGETSGAGGTSAACQSAFIDLVAGNGAPVHYVGSCSGSWGAQQSSRPVAYFLAGGAFASHLVVSGCIDPTSSAPKIEFAGFGVDTDVPSASPGVVDQYIDADQNDWAPTQQTGGIKVTQITSKSGEIVEGSFTGDVTFNGQVQTLSGTFRACKVDDENLP